MRATRKNALLLVAVLILMISQVPMSVSNDCALAESEAYDYSQIWESFGVNSSEEMYERHWLIYAAKIREHGLLQKSIFPAIYATAVQPKNCWQTGKIGIWLSSPPRMWICGHLWSGKT